MALPSLQYWFTGGALAAFLALLTAVSTLGYAWYRAAVTELEVVHNKAASAAQRERTGRVKDLLGKTVAAGTQLLRELKDKEVGQAENDAENWGQKARDLVAAAYGDGEAALFLDSSGYTFYSDGSPKSHIRNWIDGRLRRLTGLLQRADTLTVRSEFDPTKFE